MTIGSCPDFAIHQISYQYAPFKINPFTHPFSLLPLDQVLCIINTLDREII